MQMNLRKKPTFDELINYIEVEQPKIKFPDRSATFLRNSNYLSQFDGNLFDVESQQNKIIAEQIRETQIRATTAATTQGTAAISQSNAAQQQNRDTTAQAIRRTAAQAGSTAAQVIQSTVASLLGKGRDPPIVIGDGRTPIINMAADDKDDEIFEEALEEAETVTQQVQTEKERNKQKTVALVSKNLGELAKAENIRFLPQSTASSSNFNPNPVIRGDLGGTINNPQTQVREDTGGENTKRRGRAKKKG